MSCISTASSHSRCEFAFECELSNPPAVRTLEHDVLGCDYGGTSWTMRKQVDHIAESLELGPGVRLLEIGSGPGWPGLFLGTLTGCDVTLVDIPVNALRQAVDRATEDGITDRVAVVAGSGTAPPFPSGSFEHLSHSDVLCCLAEKLDMLCECRRVAGDGARMHFSVISLAPGISSSGHEQALELGPPYVDIPEGYEPLLGVSGWRILTRMKRGWYP